MSGQYKSKAGERASECRRRMSRSRCRTCSWQEEGEQVESRSRSRNGSKAGGRSRSKNSKQRNEMELMPCLRHKSLNKQMRDRGRAEKEPRISIPVPAVPVSELLAGKSQRICNSLN